MKNILSTLAFNIEIVEATVEQDYKKHAQFAFRECIFPLIHSYRENDGKYLVYFDAHSQCDVFYRSSLLFSIHCIYTHSRSQSKNKVGNLYSYRVELQCSSNKCLKVQIHTIGKHRLNGNSDNASKSLSRLVYIQSLFSTLHFFFSSQYLSSSRIQFGTHVLKHTQRVA